MAWTRAIQLALLAVALTTLFVALLFPYERIASSLSARATRWTGIELEFEEVGPTVSWRGLGLEATDVRATLPRGDSFVLPSVFLRPALSLRWLIGDPQLVFDIDGGVLGEVDGQIGLGSGGSWNARLHDIRVGVLPLAQIVPGLALEGQLSGRFAFRRDDEGRPAGELDFDCREGSLMAPGLPLPVPFERLQGKIEFGGELAANIHALALSGPVISATLSGTVQRAPRPDAQPLEMAMQIQKVGRALQPLLLELGLELAEAGPTHLQIRGTLGRPTFR